MMSSENYIWRGGDSVPFGWISTALWRWGDIANACALAAVNEAPSTRTHSGEKKSSTIILVRRKKKFTGFSFGSGLGYLAGRPPPNHPTPPYDQAGHHRKEIAGAKYATRGSYTLLHTAAPSAQRQVIEIIRMRSFTVRSERIPSSALLLGLPSLSWSKRSLCVCTKVFVFRPESNQSLQRSRPRWTCREFSTTARSFLLYLSFSLTIFQIVSSLLLLLLLLACYQPSTKGSSFS